MGDVDTLVEQYALLDRGSFPPVEILDMGGTVAEAGLRAGATIALKRRDASLQKGEPRKVKKRAPRPEKVPTSELSMLGGRLEGTLSGSYTFADEAFRRAGMVVVIAEPTAAGDAVLAALPAELHFMSLAFRLPAPTVELPASKQLEVRRDPHPHPSSSPSPLTLTLTLILTLTPHRRPGRWRCR